jgi:hypothetical protein
MEERLEEIAKTNTMLMELLEQRGIDVFRWWRFALWAAAGVTLGMLPQPDPYPHETRMLYGRGELTLGTRFHAGPINVWLRGRRLRRTIRVGRLQRGSAGGAGEPCRRERPGAASLEAEPPRRTT